MPSILFLHENYPAQFGILADYLSRKGWKVVYATQKEEIEQGKPIRTPAGVRVLRYTKSRDVTEGIHTYLRGTEGALLNGQGFARLGYALKSDGFEPDLIVAHSGWGSGSFAKVVWPDAKFVQYLEWWYRFPPVDIPRAESALGSQEDKAARVLVRNLPFLLDFQQADLVVAPTEFQADQFPDFIRPRTLVQHDGVDFDMFHPPQSDETPFRFQGLPDDAPLVVFATRGMEPARGFPTFMAAASKIQAKRPDVHILVAGGPKSHYGPAPKGFETWKDKALAEHSFDRSRLHFTGLLPKPDYAKLLRRSSVQVYLTRPFVLSWSCIEALASGAPMVVSDVAPVREALPTDDVARFVPMENADRVVEELEWCLDHPEEARAMGLRAREQGKARYDQKNSLKTLEEQFLAVLGS